MYARMRFPFCVRCHLYSLLSPLYACCVCARLCTTHLRCCCLWEISYKNECIMRIENTLLTAYTSFLFFPLKYAHFSFYCKNFADHFLLEGQTHVWSLCVHMYVVCAFRQCVLWVLNLSKKFVSHIQHACGKGVRLPSRMICVYEGVCMYAYARKCMQCTQRHKICVHKLVCPVLFSHAQLS